LECFICREGEVSDQDELRNFCDCKSLVAHHRCLLTWISKGPGPESCPRCTVCKAEPVWRSHQSELVRTRPLRWGEASSLRPGRAQPEADLEACRGPLLLNASRNVKHNTVLRSLNNMSSKVNYELSLVIRAQEDGKSETFWPSWTGIELDEVESILKIWHFFSQGRPSVQGSRSGVWLLLGARFSLRSLIALQHDDRLPSEDREAAGERRVKMPDSVLKMFFGRPPDPQLNSADRIGLVLPAPAASVVAPEGLFFGAARDNQHEHEVRPWSPAWPTDAKSKRANGITHGDTMSVVSIIVKRFRPSEYPHLEESDTMNVKTEITTMSSGEVEFEKDNTWKARLLTSVKMGSQSQRNSLRKQVLRCQHTPSERSPTGPGHPCILHHSLVPQTKTHERQEPVTSREDSGASADPTATVAGIIVESRAIDLDKRNLLIKNEKETQSPELMKAAVNQDRRQRRPLPPPHSTESEVAPAQGDSLQSCSADVRVGRVPERGPGPVRTRLWTGGKRPHSSDTSDLHDGAHQHAWALVLAGDSSSSGAPLRWLESESTQPQKRFQLSLHPETQSGEVSEIFSIFSNCNHDPLHRQQRPGVKTDAQLEAEVLQEQHVTWQDRVTSGNILKSPPNSKDAGSSKTGEKWKSDKLNLAQPPSRVACWPETPVSFWNPGPVTCERQRRSGGREHWSQAGTDVPARGPPRCEESTTRRPERERFPAARPFLQAKIRIGTIHHLSVLQAVLRRIALQDGGASLCEEPLSRDLAQISRAVTAHCCTQKISSYGAELSSEACRELGFSSNLLCSSCDLLGQFSLSQLDPFCRQCCQEEAQLETRKSTSHFVRPPVKCSPTCVTPVPFCSGSPCPRHTRESDKPKMFKGLQIKYVRGSDPVLKLLDDNGNIAEELSILKWNTDSVEEFLSEKLDRI
ncbi:SEP15 protein, partial [Atractosteus spatula]|nr:SEP15 protein [Atractosteus spatula]